MEFVKKCNCPSELAVYNATYTQGWIDHYTNKTRPVKPSDNYWTESSIREPLIKSFKDNCGYCGRKMGRLLSDRPVGQVDHFLSKSKRPDLVYTWENYVWSCADCNKGKLDEEEFLDPCNSIEMDYLHFDFASGKYILKEEFRNKGIGRKLFNALIGEAKKLNAKQLHWQVLDWNQEAIDFYDKLGAEFDKGWWNVKLLLDN